jgi:hypothetical protein
MKFLLVPLALPVVALVYSVLRLVFSSFVLVVGA